MDAFTCYVHKPDMTVPELRVVTAPSRSEVSHIVLEEVRSWGRFEKIDVYDERDQLVFTLRADPERLSA